MESEFYRCKEQEEREKDMYQILRAEKLADKIYLMEVEAPRVARVCEPGEFVIVKMDEEGERIPLPSVILTERRGLSQSYSRQSALPQKRWPD